MKAKVKLLINRVMLWIIALGPASVEVGKQIIHAISHLFGGGCTGG